MAALKMTRPVRDSNFGSFQLLQLIAISPSGTLYRARQTGVAPDVALKIFDITSPTWSPELGLPRFLSEMEAVVKLVHPSIVAIYAFGELDGVPYVSSELCDGPNLAPKLRRSERPSFSRSLEIIIDLARALDYAHCASVVHGGVKPSNALFHQDTIKLTDFGVRSLDSGHRVDPAASVEIMRYQAPEQLEHEGSDEQTDGYSLGILLYQLLTGVYPFHSKGIGPAALGGRESIVPPRWRDPSLPAEIDAICARALSIRPADRFPSCLALAHALEHLLTRREQTRRKVGGSVSSSFSTSSSRSSAQSGESRPTTPPQLPELFLIPDFPRNLQAASGPGAGLPEPMIFSVQIRENDDEVENEVVESPEVDDHNQPSLSGSTIVSPHAAPSLSALESDHLGVAAVLNTDPLDVGKTQPPGVNQVHQGGATPTAPLAGRQPPVEEGVSELALLADSDEDELELESLPGLKAINLAFPSLELTGRGASKDDGLHFDLSPNSAVSAAATVPRFSESVGEREDASPKSRLRRQDFAPASAPRPRSAGPSSVKRDATSLSPSSGVAAPLLAPQQQRVNAPMPHGQRVPATALSFSSRWPQLTILSSAAVIFAVLAFYYVAKGRDGHSADPTSVASMPGSASNGLPSVLDTTDPKIDGILMPKPDAVAGKAASEPSALVATSRTDGTNVQAGIAPVADRVTSQASSANGVGGLNPSATRRSSVGGKGRSDLDAKTTSGTSAAPSSTSVVVQSASQNVTLEFSRRESPFVRQAETKVAAAVPESAPPASTPLTIAVPNRAMHNPSALVESFAQKGTGSPSTSTPPESSEAVAPASAAATAPAASATFRLWHKTPAGFKAGQSFTLDATSAAGMRQVIIIWRVDRGTISRMRMTDVGQGDWRAELLTPDDARSIEYYFELVNQQGQRKTFREQDPYKVVARP